MSPAPVTSSTGDTSERWPDDDGRFSLFHAERNRDLRNEIVEHFMGFAIDLSRRFSSSGVADEDLRQVAMIGLVKAVDRFDPHRGVPFMGFAGPTIEGELKRHFRDATWTVRVPRSAKDLAADVRRASERLAHDFGRPPRVHEIAAHLGVTRDDVVTGLAARSAYQTDSLSSDDRSSGVAAAVLAADDQGFSDIDDRQTVERLMVGLSEKDQEVVRLRFFEELAQEEISVRVGISQMQVSRVLRRSFEQMRRTLDEPE